MPARLLACIRKESLALSRDVLALVALFLLPAVFILIMSLALQDSFRSSQSARFDYVLVDRDTSAASRAYAAQYAAAGGDRRVDGGLDALREERAQYALVIEAGFGDNLLAAIARPIVTVVGAPDLPGTALALLQARAVDRLARQRLQSLPAAPGGLSIARQMGDGLVAARYEAGDDPRPTSVQQNVPAWLIFGMFFVVLPLSSVLISERSHGTLQRLRTMRVPAQLFFAGKLVPFFAVNLLQGVVMLAVGMYVVPWFGADALRIGSSPLALAAVLASVSAAALGYALLVATFARTVEQANIVGGLGNVLLGAIGGIMVPKIVMPHAMQQLTIVSPMAWGHEAMLRLLLRGGGIADVWPQIASLIAFGVICTACAVSWHRREALR